MLSKRHPPRKYLPAGNRPSNNGMGIVVIQPWFVNIYSQPTLIVICIKQLFKLIIIVIALRILYHEIRTYPVAGKNITIFLKRQTMIWLKTKRDNVLTLNGL